MEQKIAFLVDYISNTYGTHIHSHRAGRWTINDNYFELIAKYGVNVDCTVTPGIDWSHNVGSTPGSYGTDYSSFQDTPYGINTKYGSIKEIPVTVKSSHHIFLPTEMKPKPWLKSFHNAIIGQMIWLRPNGRNLKQMIWLLKTIEKDSRYDYIMFMLHSSELMPGGSPTFRTEESIEKLYTDLDTLFKVACHSFEGSTISEYAMGSSL